MQIFKTSITQLATGLTQSEELETVFNTSQQLILQQSMQLSMQPEN